MLVYVSIPSAAIDQADRKSIMLKHGGSLMVFSNRYIMHFLKYCFEMRTSRFNDRKHQGFETFIEKKEKMIW